MGSIPRTDTDLGWINRRFRDIDRQLRELRAARTLENSSVSRGTVRFDGDSALDVQSNLALRDGIVQPAALASTVATGYAYLEAFNFALSTSEVALINTAVAVPEGFTSCVVAMTGRVFAYNSTAAADFLYARTRVGGFSGNALPVPVKAAGQTDDSGINLSPFSTVLSELVPGSTFALQLYAWTLNAAWAADPSNTAELTGTILWFR